MKTLLLTLLAVSASAQPDLIMINGAVVTVDDRFTIAEAFAVEDGAFSAVGSEDEVMALRGRATIVVDLNGGIVLPGLIDAHGHLAGLGELKVGVVDLTGTRSYEEVIERVADRAGRTEPGAWIIGRGWDHESWPEREMPVHGPLSEAVPDHPVWLARVDGHASLANAAAMTIAGISESTPNPAGGEVLREPSGALTGVFVDAAESLVSGVIPASVFGEARAALLAAQDLCLAAGLTGVHDAGVAPDLAELYSDLESSGALRLRVYGMMPAQHAARWFEENEPIAGDRFSLRACKVYADGAMGSRGAWLLEPYQDRPTDDNGMPYSGLAVTDPREIEALARHALDRGYQVCTHAIGDRANREVLDAYERALADRNADVARFRVEHAQLLHPDDIARFAALGVIASVQPTHCTSDMRWVEDRVGPARADGAYAWQSLARSGARLALGSDFPVESHNPFLGFYAAVTRLDASGSPGGGWRPAERLTREQALRGMTIDAAFAAFDEHRLGSIEPGKRADFILVDRDVLTCPEADIPATRVLQTWIDGERVFPR